MPISKKSAPTIAAKLEQHKDHIHICGFYKDMDMRLDMLSAYYEVGLKRNELCIFVTDQKPAELIRDLKKHGLDVKADVKEGRFHIYPVYDTYTPDKTFKSLRMLDNLRKFVKQSVPLGFRGVRGGGDMKWLAGKPKGWQNVVDYECRINRFIRTNNFTGICLFPAKLLNSELTKKIIQTHRYIVRSGILHDNPYYIPPEKAFRLSINTVAEIENWLDDLDEQALLAAPA
jgi:hypothetical protein